MKEIFKWIRNKKWQLRYLWFRYILGHTYTIGCNIGSQDDSCSVIVRKDKKGIRYIEKIYN